MYGFPNLILSPPPHRLYKLNNFDFFLKIKISSSLTPIDRYTHSKQSREFPNFIKRFVLGQK